MVIEGELKDRIFQIVADAIDIGRLYENAVKMVEALRDMNDDLTMSNREVIDENDNLKERCKILVSERNDLRHCVAQNASYRKAFEMARDQLANVGSNVDWVATLDMKLRHKGIDVEIPGEEPTEFADEEAKPEHDPWKRSDEYGHSKTYLDHKLSESETELEKYKTAVVVLRYVLYRHLPHGWYATIMSKVIALLKEKGYDIEHEKGHEVPEIASPIGCEDNSESQDEHDFL